MPYTRNPTWQDDPSTATPITSVKLEHIEDGIVEGAQAASEVLAGNVELASAAELTAGTDLVRAASPKRIADYVTARLAALPGATAATETAQGVVELATAGEMTTGTDLTRVPSVKRVADYVTAAVAAVSGVSGATETAQGIVELATAAELTTGTDLTRVPAVKRVADYVIASVGTLSASVTASLAAKADVSGSISQFADVIDTPPTNQNVLRFDSGSNQWRGVDLTSQFAGVGVDGRLITPANPQYYVPLLVINEGDSVPSNYPTGGVVLSRPAAASLLPSAVGKGVATSSTSTITATTTVDLAVGDYLYFAWGVSHIGTTTTISTVAVNAGAIAAFTEIGTGSVLSGTCQVRHGFAKVTTLIPAGSVVTLTSSGPHANHHLILGKVINVAATSPNDSGGSLTGSGTTTGTSGTPATITKTWGGIVTANANTVVFGLFGFNPGSTGTNGRTLASTAGWTLLDSSISSTQRGCGVFYKILTATTPGLAGAVNVVCEDGTSGAWAGILGALKAA